MMCHCRFISFNKDTTLVEDVGNRGGYACMGEGGSTEKSLYHLFNFAMSLKLLLKKKSNILEKLKATFENQDILNYKHKFGVVPSIVIEPSESMS